MSRKNAKSAYGGKPLVLSFITTFMPSLTGSRYRMEQDGCGQVYKRLDIMRLVPNRKISPFLERHKVSCWLLLPDRQF